jgi:hypothetical protein
MFKKLVLPLIIFASLVAIVACGTFNQNSYRAMGIMEASYDIGMKTAGDLRARGLISDEGRQAIIDAGRPYAVAHNEAIDAFTAYLQAENPDEKERLKQQYITASRVMLSFYSAVMDVLSKSGYIGETVEPWF